MKNTVLITGSSAGLGKAAARKFAANGWNVIATMRSPEKETELNKLENVWVTQLDVQNEGSIAEAISGGIAKFGKIDAIINNAGFGVFGAFELATTKQIHQQFDINVFGVMNMIKAVLPHFRQNKAGTIINISSQGGRVAFPAISLYHASKFAIEGFSESLSYELAIQNIIVKLIEPGDTTTSFGSSVGLTNNPDIKDYDVFVNGFFKHWETLHPEPSTPEDVAEVIYTAATDGTSQLRYLVGKDTAEVIQARENNTDPDYMDWMKKKFLSNNN